MGVGRIFSRGALGDFFKIFVGWDTKSVERSFFPVETKTTFFAEISKFQEGLGPLYPPHDAHAQKLENY